jgi:hypothetical protein
VSAPTAASIRDAAQHVSDRVRAKKLLGDRTDFVCKVRDTRNFYTHLGNAGGKSKTKTPKELFLLNHRLYAFLRCVLLIDLGIDESYLGKPILYQADR